VFGTKAKGTGSGTGAEGLEGCPHLVRRCRSDEKATGREGDIEAAGWMEGSKLVAGGFVGIRHGTTCQGSNGSGVLTVAGQKDGAVVSGARRDSFAGARTAELRNKLINSTTFQHGDALTDGCGVRWRLLRSKEKNELG
jgi:hypothetical protein